MTHQKLWIFENVEFWEVKKGTSWHNFFKNWFFPVYWDPNKAIRHYIEVLAKNFHFVTLCSTSALFMMHVKFMDLAYVLGSIKRRDFHYRSHRISTWVISSKAFGAVDDARKTREKNEKIHSPLQHWLMMKCILFSELRMRFMFQ